MIQPLFRGRLFHKLGKGLTQLKKRPPNLYLVVQFELSINYQIGYSQVSKNPGSTSTASWIKVILCSRIVLWYKHSGTINAFDFGSSVNVTCPPTNASLVQLYTEHSGRAFLFWDLSQWFNQFWQLQSRSIISGYFFTSMIFSWKIFCPKDLIVSKNYHFIPKIYNYGVSRW